jgi:hypothetical protein
MTAALVLLVVTGAVRGREKKKEQRREQVEAE